MIIILGASGKVGGKLTDLLLARHEQVTVVGRDRRKFSFAEAKGAVAAVGDISSQEFLEKTFQGADAAFVMIPPNFRAEDLREYQNAVGGAIAAALRNTGVKQVLNLSSQGADLKEGTGPVLGLRDQEERLNLLPNTKVLHLRPTYFMENLLMNVDLIRSKGIMGSSIRGDVSFAMIAARDIAAFAADRLVKRDFTGKTMHDLLGRRDLSLDDAASIIGTAIGRPALRYVTFSYADAEEGMVAMGLSRSVSRAFVELSRALNEGRFAVGLERTEQNTTSTSFEQFVGDIFLPLYRSAEKDQGIAA